MSDEYPHKGNPGDICPCGILLPSWTPCAITMREHRAAARLLRHDKLIGDAPDAVHHLAILNAIAEGIDEVFNGERGEDERRMGFVLMVFPMREGAQQSDRCNYISNCERTDVMALMREQLADFERRAKAQD